MKINFVIPCLLGLEKIIADEMKDLGAENVISENGRVLFSGDENMLARVNICSHFAERVQILVGSFEARSFEELFQGTKALILHRHPVPYSAAGLYISCPAVPPQSF